jgi:hypothetical protein
MGFLKPKVPEPPAQANPAAAPITPPGTDSSSGIAPVTASLISTSVQGLKRRASTERTSLIGGA